jgi:hypothetical protein
VSTPYTALGRLILVTLLALTHGADASQTAARPHRPIPFTLLEEHAEIVSGLKAAEAEGGAIARAARDLRTMLEPHLALEQAVALPPLRLLPRLAEGRLDDEMIEAIGIAEELRGELPTLLRQHRAIVPSLEALHAAAWAEGKPVHAFFAQRLLRHVRMDEEVLYPAALVAGDHARLRMAGRASE